jgi:hypothetical protein
MIGPVWPLQGADVMLQISLAAPPLPLTKMSASVTGTFVGPLFVTPCGNVAGSTGAPVTGR